VIHFTKEKKGGTGTSKPSGRQFSKGRRKKKGADLKAVDSLIRRSGKKKKGERGKKDTAIVNLSRRADFNIGRA